jgi:hypothetical protein
MTAASPCLFISSLLFSIPSRHYFSLSPSHTHTHTQTKSRLHLHQTLAAVNTALASLLADKTTAERRQTSTCQKEREEKRRERLTRPSDTRGPSSAAAAGPAGTGAGPGAGRSTFAAGAGARRTGLAGGRSWGTVSRAGLGCLGDRAGVSWRWRVAGAYDGVEKCGWVDGRVGECRAEAGAEAGDWGWIVLGARAGRDAPLLRVLGRALVLVVSLCRHGGRGVGDRCGGGVVVVW